MDAFESLGGRDAEHENGVDVKAAAQCLVGLEGPPGTGVTTAVTVEEVEEVVGSPEPRDDVSRTTGRPCRFGWTATGKHLIVVYDAEDVGGFVIVRPVTAYEVPPEGGERHA